MAPLVIATVNANGVRAAVRRGMPAWLARARPDVLCLQEVRADDATLAGLLEEALHVDGAGPGDGGGGGGGGWHLAHVEPTDAGTKGRAGVAVASRLPVGEARTTIDPRFDGTGRWVELDVEAPDLGVVTVASTYVHSGEAGTPKQDDKMAFLDAVTARMSALHAAAAAGGPQAVVMGDLNIAHTARDIRNAKGNRGKAGFLPEEQAHLDAWAAQGWVDVPRAPRRGRRRALLLVELARPGVRPGHRLAHRRPVGDAGARGGGHREPGRPGADVRGALQRPRPGRRHLRRLGRRDCMITEGRAGGGAGVEPAAGVAHGDAVPDGAEGVTRSA